MTPALDRPHFVVICKDAGNWVFPPEHFTRFFDEWADGATVFQAPDIWGQPCTVLLSDVRGLVEKTAESMDVLREEAAEEAQRAMLGMT